MEVVQTKIQRNSSFELLRILAMFIIVVSHSLPKSSPYVSPCEYMLDIEGILTFHDVNLIILFFLRNFGQIGNIIFVACSSYFLLESTNVKSDKIISMVINCFLISVLILLAISIIGIPLPTNIIVRQFFPVSLCNNWFITCYILFYAIHPMLNISVHTLSKEQLFVFNVFFLILYSILSFFTKAFFFNSLLINFIGVYFIVAYLKLYPPKIFMSFKNNIILLFVGILLGFLILCVTILIKHPVAYMYNMMNPSLLMIAMSLFLLAKNYNFKSYFINYISSLSMFIYIIHDNQLIIRYLKPLIYQHLYQEFSYNHLFIIVFLYSAFVYLISIIISSLYKNLFAKYISKLSSNISELISDLFYHK